MKKIRGNLPTLTIAISLVMSTLCQAQEKGGSGIGGGNQEVSLCAYARNEFQAILSSYLNPALREEVGLKADHTKGLKLLKDGFQKAIDASSLPDFGEINTVVLSYIRRGLELADVTDLNKFLNGEVELNDDERRKLFSFFVWYYEFLDDLSSETESLFFTPYLTLPRNAVNFPTLRKYEQLLLELNFRMLTSFLDKFVVADGLEIKVLKIIDVKSFLKLSAYLSKQVANEIRNSIVVPNKILAKDFDQVAIDAERYANKLSSEGNKFALSYMSAIYSQFYQLTNPKKGTHK